MAGHSPHDTSSVLERLGSAEEAARLAGYVFDFMIDQRVDRFLSPEIAHACLDAAIRSPLWPRLLRDHLIPFLERERDRARTRGDRLEDYLTAETRGLLEGLAGRPLHLAPRFLEGLLQQEAVRQLLRTVVAETLNRFVLALHGEGGGLLGQVGRAGLNTGFLGKLAAKLESRLQTTAATFMHGSLERILPGIVPALSTPEMAKHLGQLVLQQFRAALGWGTATVWEAMARLPMEEILAALPGLARHNWGRTSVRETAMQEVEAFLAREGARTIREVVGDEDLIATWREAVVGIGGPLLAAFAATPGFRAWRA
jgi:hypothetical protein